MNDRAVTIGFKCKTKFFLKAISTVLSLLLFALWMTPTSAHISPSDCSGSGLGIGLYSSSNKVHVGDVISYSVDIFNGLGIGPVVCDVSDIQASLVTPDGQTHSLVLLRTALENGDLDSYSNVVTYTARVQDIQPDGTLVATASDSGVIHQNITNSQGGGNQGVNIEVLSTLHVVKQVVNDDGGSATPSIFNLHVKLSGTDVAGSPASGVISPGVTYSLDPGTYVVSEDANASYAQSFSGGCGASGSVTLAAGEDKTCTVTNDDIAPPPPPPAILRIVKQVINDNDGVATSSVFNLHVKLSGTDIAGSPASGTEAPGTAYSLSAGTYVV
ncbi:MAG: hypothetical protein NUV53_05415, partial [Patescibacteria group bacterium]|nr:hypothetical protein [Patescibacteria group bacterium]